MRLVSALLFLAACTDGSSGASCPTTRVPTYANFGRGFFAKYCTACHSGHATDRHGAPPGLDFDDEPSVRRHARAIDSEAAAGPDSTNTDMPDMGGPVEVAPTLAERELLGEFLACER